MSAHQAMYPIRTMARVLKVSASGYYAWRSRPASARATADADLTRHIRTIHAGSHGTYGAPRVHAELKADGLSVGRKRIARLMRAAGIAGVSRRRSAPITTRQATDHHPASDLVRRNFMAERSNELWVADITFLPTLAGFLYLAVVLDAWSRRIVGWAFSVDLKTRVVLDALDMALMARKPDNVVHHSDTSEDKRQFPGGLALIAMVQPVRLAPRGALCGLTHTQIDQPCLSPDLSTARERLAVRLCLADACDPRRA